MANMISRNITHALFQSSEFIQSDQCAVGRGMVTVGQDLCELKNAALDLYAVNTNQKEEVYAEIGHTSGRAAMLAGHTMQTLVTAEEAGAQLALGASEVAAGPILGVAHGVLGAYNAYRAIKAGDAYNQLVKDIQNQEIGLFPFLTNHLSLNEEEQQLPLEAQVRIVEEKHKAFKKLVKGTGKERPKQLYERSLALLHYRDAIQGIELEARDVETKALRLLAHDLTYQIFLNSRERTGNALLGGVNVVCAATAIPSNGLSCGIAAAVTVAHTASKGKITKKLWKKTPLGGARGPSILEEMNVDFHQKRKASFREG